VQERKIIPYYAPVTRTVIYYFTDMRNIKDPTENYSIKDAEGQLLVRKNHLQKKCR
jgi:hypothetical protein